MRILTTTRDNQDYVLTSDLGLWVFDGSNNEIEIRKGNSLSVNVNGDNNSVFATDVWGASGDDKVNVTGNNNSVDGGTGNDVLTPPTEPAMSFSAAPVTTP